MIYLKGNLVSYHFTTEAQMSQAMTRDELQDKLRGWVLPTTRASVDYPPLLIVTFPVAIVILSLPAEVRHLIMFRDRSPETLASAAAMKDLGSLVVPPIPEPVSS
jgi:hypothetical protein